MEKGNFQNRNMNQPFLQNNPMQPGMMPPQQRPMMTQNQPMQPMIGPTPNQVPGGMNRPFMQGPGQNIQPGQFNQFQQRPIMKVRPGQQTWGK